MRRAPSMIIAVAVAIVFFAAARPAYAKKQEETRLNGLFPTKPPAVDCTTCHTGWRDAERRTPIRSLNSFGQDYRRWRRDRNATPQTLIDDDSDNDGVSNGDEIRKGSNPGDRDSTPAPPEAKTSRIDPDPGGRLKEVADGLAKSSDRRRQRDGTFLRLLLALVAEDEAELGKLVPSAGYREAGETESLSAKEMIQRWRELNVRWPAAAPLDRVMQCTQPDTLSSALLRREVPALGQTSLPSTQFALRAAAVGNAECLRQSPVLVLEMRHGRWYVITGNVLSCWVPGPSTTQPTSAPADKNATDGPGAATQPVHADAESSSRDAAAKRSTGAPATRPAR